MMNTKFISIFMGNNSVNLLGCENDALLFFNINLFENKTILLGDDATFKNLENILKNNLNLTDLFIFFSGHGFKGGGIKLYDIIMRPLQLYDLINHIFVHPINLYIILDCCYSGGFPQVKNFNKIKNNYIIASSDINQKSAECLIKYDEQLFLDKKPKVIKNHIVIGLFSYNIIKLILEKNFKDPNNIFLDLNESDCIELESLTKQKIIIKK